MYATRRCSTRLNESEAQAQAQQEGSGDWRHDMSKAQLSATLANNSSGRMLQFLLLVTLMGSGAVCALHYGDAPASDDDSLRQYFQHHRQLQQQQQQQHHQHQEAALQHHQHHRRRLQRRDSPSHAKDGQCESVKDYLKSIDVPMPSGGGGNNVKGAVCGGNCCSNATETELRYKAAKEFERLLHDHTKNLRDVLETTFSLFQSHILELVEQSENKTLHVYSQVYKRMIPLSRKLIQQLYTEIISHLKYTNNYNVNAFNHHSLEEAVHRFFVNLFPVAYHQAVHLSKDNYGDLNEEYIDCLKHSFDELEPFGQIPKEINANLKQSVQTATTFMNALLQSAESLSETDKLYAVFLTDTCKKQLLKMKYCPTCVGYPRAQVKVCYSYCMNVFRGCSAQFASVLDGAWSSVVDALDNLVASHIRSDSGIVTTIKQLDTKLADSIMLAMEKGPELEKKVRSNCGIPKLSLAMKMEAEQRTLPTHNVKWATPPDSQIQLFLSKIDRSKEFYSNIVNIVCEDEDIQRNDNHCWTGDRIGEYSQIAMPAGADRQRYNPEVPLEVGAQTSKLNELTDKLIKIRKNIGATIPQFFRDFSDIQSDMGRQVEEGSGRITDNDDEEYGNVNGSGDGSGDGATPTVFDTTGPTIITNNDIETRSGAPTLRTVASFKFAIMSLIVILVTSVIGSSS